MSIITFSAMKESEQNELNDIIDALRVTAELSGYSVKFNQSWVDCALEYSDTHFSYKLIFEVKAGKRHEFDCVKLHEYIKGSFGYPILFSSGMYRYKSGKLTRPIASFIKKIEEMNNVELF